VPCDWTVTSYYTKKLKSIKMQKKVDIQETPLADLYKSIKAG